MDALFDRDYFETVYKNYGKQNPARKLRFYRRLVEPLLPPGGSVLDLGCAFGLFLSTLEPATPRFGMDASEYAVRAARRNAAGARLVVADCANAPFSAKFDAIVAFDVLEHVPQLDNVGRFVEASLKPGGAFVFVVPVYDGPLGPLVRRLDKDPTHVHKQSRRWWLEWASTRFDIGAWTGALRYLTPPGYYVHLPSRSIRAFAPAVAIVARPRGHGSLSPDQQAAQDLMHAPVRRT